MSQRGYLYAAIVLYAAMVLVAAAAGSRLAGATLCLLFLWGALAPRRRNHDEPSETGEGA